MNPAEQAGVLGIYAGSEVPVVVDLRVLDGGEDVDMDADIDTGSARTGRLILSSANNGGELIALK